jgi:hypothetical protein
LGRLRSKGWGRAGYSARPQPRVGRDCPIPGPPLPKPGMAARARLGGNIRLKRGKAFQYLKNPLAAGATWQWKGKGMMGVDIDESNEVAGAEEVAVPAGRFKAMRVVTKVMQGGTPVTKTYWFANHIGLVKSMTDTGSVQSTAELVDYSFKPK